MSQTGLKAAPKTSACRRRIARRLVAMAAAAAISAIASSPGFAGQWNWLDRSPVRFFNDQDWRMLQTTARQLLNGAPDGTTKGWNNPDTNSSGKITVLDTQNNSGTTCRHARFRNRGGGFTGAGTFLLCKQSGGKWKIAQ